MQCLVELSRWDDLNDFAKRVFVNNEITLGSGKKQKAAVLAARGSWAVGNTS